MDKMFDPDDSIKTREASRAVLFDEHDLVPLLFVSKHDYHKLPGGGLHKGEDRSQALIRECLEEIGCDIQVTGEVGKIIEFRSRWNFKQTSYCYIGNVLLKGRARFTEKEQGFKIVWTSLREAISKLTYDRPKDYHGSCVKKRDLMFLKRAEQML